MKFSYALLSRQKRSLWRVVLIFFGIFGLAIGGALAVVTTIERGAPDWKVFIFTLVTALGIPLGLFLLSCLFQLPGHIRFRRMVKAQETFPGEFEEAVKQAVVCGQDTSEFPPSVATRQQGLAFSPGKSRRVAATPVGTDGHIFTAGDWLVAVGEAAVRRENIVKQSAHGEIIKRRMHAFGLSRCVITLQTRNLPWKHMKIIAKDRERVMRFIGNWRKEKAQATKAH